LADLTFKLGEFVWFDVSDCYCVPFWFWLLLGQYFYDFVFFLFD